MIRWFSLFLVSIALGACATIPSGSDQIEARSVLGRDVFGDEYVYFHVTSQGAIADAAFVSMSATAVPSAMAKRLAGILAAGESRQTRILVSGAASKKAAVVLRDALKLNETRRLPKLELMYAGDESQEQELRNIAESLGASFYFKSY